MLSNLNYIFSKNLKTLVENMKILLNCLFKIYKTLKKIKKVYTSPTYIVVMLLQIAFNFLFF